MDVLKKFFPTAFKSTELKPFIISLVIYGVIGLIGELVFGLLSLIPIINIIAAILGWLLGIYVTAGVVLSILVFLKVIK